MLSICSRAQCSLLGVLTLDSFVDFDAIIYLLLVYIVCFHNDLFFLAFSLLIFSSDNKPAPFPSWRL